MNSHAGMLLGWLEARCSQRSGAVGGELDTSDESGERERECRMSGGSEERVGRWSKGSSSVETEEKREERESIEGVSRISKRVK